MSKIKITVKWWVYPLILMEVVYAAYLGITQSLAAGLSNFGVFVLVAIVTVITKLLLSKS